MRLQKRTLQIKLMKILREIEVFCIARVRYIYIYIFPFWHISFCSMKKGIKKEYFFFGWKDVHRFCFIQQHFCCLLIFHCLKSYLVLIYSKYSNLFDKARAPDKHKRCNKSIKQITKGGRDLSATKAARASNSLTHNKN